MDNTSSVTGPVSEHQPSPERLQVEAMLSEGGGVPTATADPPTGVPISPAPAEQMSTAPTAAGSWLKRSLQRAAQRVGYKYIVQLAQAKGRVSETLKDVADHAHRRAEQTRLALELVDDFKDGTYRQVPWVSVTILAGALLYLINPHDVIPDFLPGVGALDDMTLLALAIRMTQKDLVNYCRFKGYREADFFGPSSPATATN